MLELHHISKVFNVHGRAIFALKNVSCQFREKELYVVAGPNGSGKTTLLRIAAFNLLPSSGEIFLDGVYINPQNSLLRIQLRSSLISFSPQHPCLPLWLTGTEAARFIPNIRKDLFEYYCTVLKAEDVLKRPLGELSMGTRKKANHAFVLSRVAKYYIFDEPFAFLDDTSQECLREIFFDLTGKMSATVIVSTPHNLMQSSTENVIFLENGECVKGPHEI